MEFYANTGAGGVAAMLPVGGFAEYIFAWPGLIFERFLRAVPIHVHHFIFPVSLVEEGYCPPQKSLPQMTPEFTISIEWRF